MHHGAQAICQGVAGSPSGGFGKPGRVAHQVGDVVGGIGAALELDLSLNALDLQHGTNHISNAGRPARANIIGTLGGQLEIEDSQIGRRHVSHIDEVPDAIPSGHLDGGSVGLGGRSQPS